MLQRGKLHRCASLATVAKNTLKVNKQRKKITDEVSSLSAFLSVQMTHASDLLTRRIARRFKDCGVSMAASRVLAVLHENDGQAVGEIAARCYLHQPSVTKALEQLEREALIRRTRDGSDGRLVFAHLTNKGHQRALQLIEIVQDVEQADLAGYPVENRRRLQELLDQLIALLEAKRF